MDYDRVSFRSIPITCRLPGPSGTGGGARPPLDPRLAGCGERLLRLRLLRGHERRTTLAPLLGVDIDTLRVYEEGRTIPPSHVLVRLADLLDCTTDYILTGSPRGMPHETLRALAAITPAQIAQARMRGPVRRKDPGP